MGMGKMLVLDVGCGSDPKGNVNVDLRMAADPSAHFFLDVRNIPNFIRADGQYLPFKDESFDKVVSYHTIEHVPNPYLFLSELIRVAKYKIVLKTPHRLSQGKFSPHRTQYHINFFSYGWFRKVLGRMKNEGKIFRFRIKINYAPLRLPILRFALPLLFPYEIEVEILKNPNIIIGDEK